MYVFETVGMVYLLVLDIIIICANTFVLGLICFNPKLRNATGNLKESPLVLNLNCMKGGWGGMISTNISFSLCFPFSPGQTVRMD